MNIHSAFNLILKRAWLIAICALVAAGVAAAVNASIKPEYEAVTLLSVNQLSSEGSLTDYDTILANALLAKTYGETLTSRAILTEVIGTMKLPYAPVELAKHVNVDIVPDTQLLHLRVVDNDPQRAADIANSIVSIFRQHNQSALSQRYTTARQSMEAELLRVREELDASSKALDQLRATTSTPEQQLRDAEIRVNQDRNEYAVLSEALSKVLIGETQSADSIDVLESAYPNNIAIWPKPILNIVIAALSGALIGAFLALMLGAPRDATRATTVSPGLTSTPPNALE